MSTERKIEVFVDSLSACDVLPNTTNPYTNADLAANLRAYLSLLVAFPYSGHLLVGEAPGYKGCARCGIPFTSERVINERRHPFVVALRDAVKVAGNQTEISATKVWNQLEGKKAVPAFWNAFPFHPWVQGNPTKNRKPTPAETSIGLRFLDALVNIIRPHTIVAVGGVANRLLQPRYGNQSYTSFSHPSMGGFAGFVAGFSQLGLN